ncbi:MAG: hypothetical protein P8Y78_14100 [Acidihalobacter sp.]
MCRGHGHQRIEVDRGGAVDEVAVAVGVLGVYQRKVRVQGGLDGPGAAVALDLLTLRGDLGLQADVREEAVVAGAGTADLLRQQSLRMDLHFHAAGVHLLDGDAVKADVGGDQTRYPPRLDQPTDADSGLVGVVLDQSEILLPLRQQFLEQGERRTRRAEAADHDGGAVGDTRDGFPYRGVFVRKTGHFGFDSGD